MTWTPACIPDQNGRVAVVTGANGGLGYETTYRLAARGAHVVMAVRNQRKAEAARAALLSTLPAATVEILPLDLASQASVHHAAQTLTATHRKIDLLINNAGVMGTAEAHTVDGYEQQLGVDHLGHWTLTALLMPALLRARGSRVVTVTSMARWIGSPLDPQNVHLRGNYGPWRAYGQAKLANYHFGLGLQQVFDNAGVGSASVIAHPGAARTDLTATSVRSSEHGVSQRLLDLATHAVGMRPADGAGPQLRAATDPAVRGGQLCAPLFVARGPAVPRHVSRSQKTLEAIRVLWRVSENETGIGIDLPTRGRWLPRDPR
ncbi:oxidoreductase [Nocardia sp. NPDC003693]